jgi:copper chaperone CopZ
MNTRTFSVPNISCDHCVRTIHRELVALPGVHEVEGNVARKEITVNYGPEETLDRIKETMSEIGYPLA